MRSQNVPSWLVLVASLAGCTYPHAPADSGTTDAGRPADGGTMDAGQDAATATDAGPMDAGPIDASVDMGPPDTASDVGPDGGPVLYHGWASPIAGCLTASYDTSTVTALGGTYPYNAADTADCRAWKLAATVCTTEPMMYVDATNWTCPVSGGFTDPVFGTYCAAAGAQYACSTCPGACNAGPSCVFHVLSLRNCTGTEAAQN